MEIYRELNLKKNGHFVYIDKFALRDDVKIKGQWERKGDTIKLNKFSVPSWTTHAFKEKWLLKENKLCPIMDSIGCLTKK